MITNTGRSHDPNIYSHDYAHHRSRLGHLCSRFHTGRPPTGGTPGRSLHFGNPPGDGHDPAYSSSPANCTGRHPRFGFNYPGYFPGLAQPDGLHTFAAAAISSRRAHHHFRPCPPAAWQPRISGVLPGPPRAPGPGRRLPK